LVRLQKYLAECGVASRRACERLIEEGRVLVNGAVATVGQSIEPNQDTVTIDGNSIAHDERVYLVLNKPAGVVTSAHDEFGRKTVLDCLKGVRSRVYPVGRLDMDVEGVLLLTNDGEMANRLMHPRYGINKIYWAQVRGRISKEVLEQLAFGVQLDDGMTAPAEASLLGVESNSTQIQLVLREGRKREVKRMCAAVGHPVKKLRRIAFANIEADGLRPGEWRYLTDSELATLRGITGLQ